MAKLSRAEIRAAASKAGFTGEDLNIAVAVALAESGGDPRSHNSVPPDNSYGLWQINMLGSMGPDRRKTFGLKSNDDLFDPDTNARVAYGIWKSQGWKRGWTTYSHGTYKKFLTGDDSTSNGDEAAATSPVASTPGNPINGIGDAINAFGATIFKGFANIAGIAVAIVLLILGVIILSRSQIAKVLPAGKISKVAKGVSS